MVVHLEFGRLVLKDERPGRPGGYRIKKFHYSKSASGNINCRSEKANKVSKGIVKYPEGIKPGQGREQEEGVEKVER